MEMLRNLTLLVVCLSLTFLAPACAPQDEVEQGTQGEVVPAPETGEAKAPLYEPSIGYPVKPVETPGSTVHQVVEDEGAPPQVLVLTPNQGLSKGGTLVTVQGNYFSPDAEIYFGEHKSTSTFFINSQFFNVTTPPGVPGSVRVSVINPDGGEGSLENGYLYKDPLEVHSVTPSEGAAVGGEPVTIIGDGFIPEVKVLFDDRLAMDVSVVSGSELTCTTPGGSVGWVTVRVIIVGEIVAALPFAYRYFAAPEIQNLWPPNGPTIGGTEIELTGRYFAPGMSAVLGGKDATVVSVDESGKKAVILAPGGPVGPADLVVTTDDGEGFMESAFTYLAAANGLKLWSVSPAHGSASGGYSVALNVQDLNPQSPFSVSFGGLNASVISTDLYPNTVYVKTPPGAVGPVDVTINQMGQESILENGFTFTEPLGITSVYPAAGPADGGQSVVVNGEGFDSLPSSQMKLRFGPTLVDGFKVLSDAQIEFTTPACPPGFVSLTVYAGDNQVTLIEAYECRVDTPLLLAVDPAEASQAGGTLVKLIGLGLPADMNVTVNGEPATDFHDQSGISAWMRVPRGDMGPAVVSLEASGAEGEIPGLDLVGAFRFFDPANRKAPVWGAPIKRTLNVSIFNGNTGKRVPNATAILGHDPETKYMCKTDDRGQCVISFHDLAGAQQLTAAKKKYSAYTLSGFNGSNVTLYIRNQKPPGNLGPPGVAEQSVNINTLIGQVSGKVSGLGKYVVAPPGDCKIIGSPDGKQCIACDELTSCADALDCLPVGDTGAWCVAGCETSADCSPGFACINLGEGPHCVPHGGDVSAYCEVSRRSYFGSNPDPGPGTNVDPTDYTYSIAARLGEVTVYCVGGYTHPYTGKFIATAMGINEHNFIALGQQYSDVDVTLSIPLTRTLRARIFQKPTHEAGLRPLDFRAAVDIGAEGWIPFNTDPTYEDGELKFFAGYPHSLAPFGPAAAYTFYSRYNADVTSGVSPGSYRLAHRVESVDGEPILNRSNDGGEWEHPESGMSGDLNAIWGSGTDDVFGVGPNGRIVHLGVLGWGPQPTTTQLDLNDIWGTSATDIWAVGEAGTILHFDGVSWSKQILSEPVNWDIKGVHDQWAVGDGGVLQNQDGVWTPMPTLHSKGLKAVRTVNEGLAVAVGRNGKALEWDGSAWNATVVTTSANDLNALWDNGYEVVTVGNAGTIASRGEDGQWTVVAAPPTARDLYALADDKNGTLYAAGSVGTVLRRLENGEWVDETSEAAKHLDILSMWSDGQTLFAGGVNSLPLGPWMAFPIPVNPTWYQFMDHSRIEWDYDDGGPVPTFNRLYMSSGDGFTVWDVMTAGPISLIQLPSLPQIIQHSPLQEGQKYFNLSRANNPDFSIDGFRWKHTSIWRRTSWSSTYGIFY